MKRLPLLILICISLVANAQVEIIPAVDTCLYIAVDNPVSIKSSSIPLNELTLRTSNGTATGNNGHYIIKCSKPQANALLEVVYKNKVVASKKININRITDPVVYPLGELLFTNGAITVKQLNTLQSLVVKLNYPLLNFSVTDFTVEIIHDGKSTGNIKNAGKDLSQEVKSFLKYAVPGDEILFDSIKVVTGSGKKHVPQVKLKVI